MRHSLLTPPARLLGVLTLATLGLSSVHAKTKTPPNLGNFPSAETDV